MAFGRFVISGLLWTYLSYSCESDGYRGCDQSVARTGAIALSRPLPSLHGIQGDECGGQGLQEFHQAYIGNERVGSDDESGAEEATENYRYTQSKAKA